MERNPLKKKFAITSSVPPYEPTQRAKPRFKIIQELNSNTRYSHSSSHKLFITHEAIGQIFDHIGWGKRTASNQVEQGGILLGHVFRDEHENLMYGIVEASVAGSSARGSSAHLEMTHETWKEMLDSVDNMLSQHSQKHLQIIGWYHTHPNQLDVFMSGTDHATQSRLFSHDWQFAIVMNPHRKHWRAFYGNNATECSGFIVEDIKDSQLSQTSATLPSVSVEQSGLDAVEDIQESTANRTLVDNQARVASQNRDNSSNSPISAKKLNFFIWLYGSLLMLVLLFEVINTCLHLIPIFKNVSLRKLIFG